MTETAPEAVGVRVVSVVVSVVASVVVSVVVSVERPKQPATTEPPTRASSRRLFSDRGDIRERTGNDR